MNGKGAHSMGKGSVSVNTLRLCTTIIAITTIISWALLINNANNRKLMVGEKNNSNNEFSKYNSNNRKKT